nr:hypothetical protein [Butyricicoccus faecihominis]
MNAAPANMVNAQANASTSARTFLRFAGKSQKDFKHLKMPENRRCMQQFRKNKTAANIHKLDICGGICTEKSTEKNNFNIASQPETARSTVTTACSCVYPSLGRNRLFSLPGIMPISRIAYTLLRAQSPSWVSSAFGLSLAAPTPAVMLPAISAAAHK